MRSLTCDLLPVAFKLPCLMREKKDEVNGEMGQVIWTPTINAPQKIKVLKLSWK